MNDFLNQFPYSDFHEMNLDWILKKMKELAAEMNDFEAVNQIKFVGPWDISKQYGVNSLVTDDDYGYISLRSVPAGIDIHNTDYWLFVSIIKIDQNFDPDSYNAIANKTVTEKFNDIDTEISDFYVSVKSYGAKGDGVTDDTAAILACISENDNVYFPDGTYIITSTINIDSSKSILGAANTEMRNGSKLKFYGSLVSCINITSNNVNIKNINIDGTETSNSIGIYKHNTQADVMANIADCLENVHVGNCDTGFKFETYAFFNNLSRCKAHKCGTGFHIESATTTTLNLCWARECDTGYIIKNVEYSNLISCACDGCDHGYTISRSKHINFLSCGCEICNNPMIESANSKVSIIGCYGYHNGKTPGTTSSFLYASYGEYTIIGCGEELGTNEPNFCIWSNHATLDISNNDFPKPISCNNGEIFGTSTINNNKLLFGQGYSTPQDYANTTITVNDFTGAVRTLRNGNSIQFVIDLRCAGTSVDGTFDLIADTGVRPKYEMTKNVYQGNLDLKYQIVLQTSGKLQIVLSGNTYTASKYITETVSFTV